MIDGDDQVYITPLQKRVYGESPSIGFAEQDITSHRVLDPYIPFSDDCVDVYIAEKYGFELKDRCGTCGDIMDE